MSPKIFSITDREELRVKMLDAGFELIKQYGMTHASVEKITQAAGLGKSTFYNFFSSKEEFVTGIMEYQRDRVKQHFETLLNGREKRIWNNYAVHPHRNACPRMMPTMTSGRPKSCTACWITWRECGRMWTSM